MSGRASVSAVIVTKDAEDVLADALASVAWVDEIVIVDQFSTDGTLDLCRAHSQCRIFQRDDYIFLNANYGFEQATGEWILRLDADERITPELGEELRIFLADPPDGINGVEARENVYRLGRPLKHGFGREHYRKTMFRKGAARYPGRTEHESLDSTGPWIRARHGYDHFNYPRVRDYLPKTNYYTDADVDRAPLPERAPSAWSGALLTARLFYLYFLKWRGYKDGWIGFVDASMRAFYAFVEWAKLRERWERERGELRAH